MARAPSCEKVSSHNRCSKFQKFHLKRVEERGRARAIAVHMADDGNGACGATTASRHVVDEDREGSRCAFILDLPIELIAELCTHVTLSSLQRFSEASHGALHATSQDGIWRALFAKRHWTCALALAMTEVMPPEGGWRAAYQRAARAESPLVLQPDTFRTLVGFARDERPVASRCCEPSGGLGEALDAALGRVGLLRSGVDGGVGAAPLRGAHVVVIVGRPLLENGGEMTESVLHGLFARGAKRVRLVDATSSALRAVGVATGTVLHYGIDLSASCVAEGVRLPPPPRGEVYGVGLRRVVERLVETTPQPAASTPAPSASASPPSAPPPPLALACAMVRVMAATTSEEDDEGETAAELARQPAQAAHRPVAGSAVAAAAVACGRADVRRCIALGKDLAWLLQTHCYVRAVSVARRPVSTEEATMAECTLVAPSGRRYTLAEQRFLAYESCLRPPTAAEAVAAAGLRPQRPGASSELPTIGGMVEVLRGAIEGQRRELIGELYGAILPVGPGGGVPGLRQRLEAELRTIRAEPSMPRSLRPRVLDAALDGWSGGGSGQGGGFALGLGGASGSHREAAHSSSCDAAAWPLTPAETCAWRGVAAQACGRLEARPRGTAGSAVGDAGWIYPEMFRRDPRLTTRAALKALGCMSTRSADACSAIAAGGTQSTSQSRRLGASAGAYTAAP